MQCAYFLYYTSFCCVSSVKTECIQHFFTYYCFFVFDFLLAKMSFNNRLKPCLNLQHSVGVFIFSRETIISSLGFSMFYIPVHLSNCYLHIYITFLPAWHQSINVTAERNRGSLILTNRLQFLAFTPDALAHFFLLPNSILVTLESFVYTWKVLCWKNKPS